MFSAFCCSVLGREAALEHTKTSSFSNGLIWFGAAISIAEILTGTLVAPLGFTNGLLAIILGHSIGCIVLYLAGLIGANTQKSAMETVKISFGQKGSLLFSSLNILQLIGWTAVMIVSGAAAAGSVQAVGGDWVWGLVISVLIILWLLIGLQNIGKLNIVAMSGLFVLTVVMSTVVFKGHHEFISDESISFGAAVELSAAMPMSWLPLISDYTRTAAEPKKATAVSAIVYFLVSCWMYAIGMGAAIFTGESDIAKIMLNAGLGSIGLVIVIFSTVTTTFLDVYSAGVSCESISAKIKEKPAAIAVCFIGTALALFTPIAQFENFLYFIGSVFAPMTAILLTDYFLLKKDHTAKSFSIQNLAIWVVGFIIYRLFMSVDTPVGYTLPVMAITALLCILINKTITGEKHV